MFLVDYLKRYPFSLAIVATVLYLSFFQPPSIEMPVFLFPHIDKVVHLCMYGGLSGVLWLEFLLNHRRQMIRWHGWIGAVLCPSLMSGVIELLQEYGTVHRGGDWLDVAANVTGIALATAFAYFVLKPWIIKS